jgi:hypothetical protein
VPPRGELDPVQQQVLAQAPRERRITAAVDGMDRGREVPHEPERRIGAADAARALEADALRDVVPEQAGRDQARGR